MATKNNNKLCDGCGMIRDGKCPIYKQDVEKLNVDHCYVKPHSL